MEIPGRVDFTSEQIEMLIERIEKSGLAKEDCSVITSLLRAIVWLNLSLQEKKITVQRLRKIFGIKTESAKKLLKLVGEPNDYETSEKDGSSDETEEGQQSDAEKTAKGHGHRSASEYPNARIIDIAHETLKKGDICPDCSSGRLSQLPAGSVIRIVGTPFLQIDLYKPERLRCSVCGKTFTARLPNEIALEPRADNSARAIVCLMKYKAGVPFYRQAQMQEAVGSPVSASELWSMTKEVSVIVEPIHGCLCAQAANGELIHVDDTTNQVLSILLEQKENEARKDKDVRKGIHTTAILSNVGEQQIALYFTGRKHAGENLEDLLKGRSDGLPTPIQECDALSRNKPKHAETDLANCLSHARRNFYELVDFWPKPVMKIIGHFKTIFMNDRSAPVSPEERLAWHQKHSSDLMAEIKRYSNELIDNKEIEPNSSFGRATRYLNNNWEGLTCFLRLPGVPLTNNACERLIKRAVLNRKNAYFFLTEAGAEIGDILLSIIETCTLNNVNSWDYLLAVQKYKDSAARKPFLWLPWNYQEQIQEQPPT
jgi:transposase